MPNRRIFWRPRFSLRTLLIVTTLIAAIAGWLTQTSLRQRRAVAELTKLGGDVVYKHKVNPQSISWCPEWLRNWLGIDFFAKATEVQFAEMSGSQIRIQPPSADSTVVLSERSQELRKLSRRNILMATTSLGPASPTVINEEVMQQVARLPYLRKLTLGMLTTTKAKSRAHMMNGTNSFELNAQSLRIFKDHSTLEEIDLTIMEADDEVLAALHGFGNLKILRLGAFGFSAEGGKHLESLANLEEISFGPERVQQSYKSRFQPWQLTKDFPRLANLRVLGLPNKTFGNESARLLAGKLPRLQAIESGSLRLNDHGIQWLSSFSDLRELNLIDSRITDEGAVHLAKLTELRSLILTNNPISDEGLRHLSALKRLETLYLKHLPITDAGLTHLRGATAMRELMLSGTKITDAGLAHLSNMNNLHSLDVSFTAISDKSIAQLLAFKKLSNIRLLGTGVTADGAGRLRQAFPTAKIVTPDAADQWIRRTP